MVASMAEKPKTTYRLSASARPSSLSRSPFFYVIDPRSVFVEREGGGPAVILSPSMSNAGRGNPHGLGKDVLGDRNTLLSFCVFGIVFIFPAFGSSAPNSLRPSVDPVPPSIRPR